MSSIHPRTQTLTFVLAFSLILPCLTASPASGLEYGRVAGTVSDTEGNPLMGATVLLMGPRWLGSSTAENAVERIITDAQGRFAVERLVPGWYSLRITSPTRLPVMRNGIRIQAGETFQQRFVLSDIFAPLQIQTPSGSVSNWGDDWKWILRTSAATRPVLRYHQVTMATADEGSKPPLPASRCLIGMIPGSDRRGALAGDPGLGSILAYLRPLSEDSDLLVAGSMAANGLRASSVATAFRKNLMKGDAQELALVVHQLTFSDGSPFASAGTNNLVRGQGVVASYSHTRRLSNSLIMTGGLEIDYLSAGLGVTSARPRMALEYRADPSTLVAVRYGAVSVDGTSTLLERIGTLNDFPRVTLRHYRLRLEELNHAEAGVQRKLSKASQIEVAVYHDDFQNAVVQGSSRAEAPSSLAGNLLPNFGADGVMLNAGNYRSSGLRAAYTRSVGEHVETAFDYALGDALIADTPVGPQGRLRPERSQSFAGRISTRIPVTKTQVTTSYEWLQRGRVTGVDPYGQATLQLQPFLGVQVRQPLPLIAFLPAHIEALADFRNLLGEGNTSLASSAGQPYLLTSVYRSFRGGFSVQF
jgi:hypothetical protein